MDEHETWRPGDLEAVRLAVSKPWSWLAGWAGLFFPPARITRWLGCDLFAGAWMIPPGRDALQAPKNLVPIPAALYLPKIWTSLLFSVCLVLRYYIGSQRRNLDQDSLPSPWAEQAEGSCW